MKDVDDRMNKTMRLLLWFCISLATMSCGTPGGPAASIDSTIDSCGVFPSLVELEALPAIRRDLAREVLQSLPKAWGQRSELRLPNRFFTLFVGYPVGDGSSASSVEASARESLESGGWQQCPDARPEVIGIRFIDGHPVVARIVDPSIAQPGESYNVPDVVQLEFSPVDFRIPSNDAST